jgi:hypothetical protein
MYGFIVSVLQLAMVGQECNKVFADERRNAAGEREKKPLD